MTVIQTGMAYGLGIISGSMIINAGLSSNMVFQVGNTSVATIGTSAALPPTTSMVMLFLAPTLLLLLIVLVLPL